MLKDIPELIVTDIAVAVVPEKNELNEDMWNVYLVNLKDEAIEGVLVSSRGYGERDGETVKTSTLRHFLDEVPPKSYRLIEPMINDVLGLNNEYWVSFYQDKKMFDRKYLFLPDSIKKDFFSHVPLIEKMGVVIK